jgi:hypothetical protein
VGFDDVFWGVCGHVFARGGDARGDKDCGAGAEESDLAGWTVLDDSSGLYADDIEQRYNISGHAYGEGQ